MGKGGITGYPFLARTTGKHAESMGYRDGIVPIKPSIGRC